MPTWKAIKSTVGRWIIPTLAIGLATALAIQGACALDRLIQVPIPDGLAAMMGHSPNATVSLYDTSFFLEEVQLKVKHEMLRFSDNVDDAVSRYNMLTGLWASLQSQLAVVAPGLPGGTLALAALASVGTLFVDRPGTKRRLLDARNGGNGLDNRASTG